MIGAARLFPPLDHELKIPRRGPSARLQRKVCEANRAGSFEKASQILDKVGDLKISAKRVQLITEDIGRILQEERDEATEAFLNHKPPPAQADPPIQLLVISTDGGRVQTRPSESEEKWKEDKIAVVYEATATPEQPGKDYEGPKPIRRSFVATMEQWDRLADHASALADARGYDRAITKLFMGDSAAGIHSMHERCFPDAVFILDWKHTTNHLLGASVAAFGLGVKGEDWLERQKDRLWNGHKDRAIGELRKLSKQAGPPAPRSNENDPRRILANTVQYFELNYNAIDYPLYRRNGWPVGSGIIEGAVKQFGQRVKGTEKHWSIDGVEETLQVTAHQISEDRRWDDFWQRCPMADGP